MRRLASAAALALTACASAEATPARDPALPAPGSALSVMGTWISFHAAFDGELAADVAGGGSQPLNVQGTPAFADGVHGRAVHLGVAGGGARVEYPLLHNLDFSRPGGLSSWVSPRAWRASAQRTGYVRFVRVGGRERSTFVLERDVRREANEQIVVGFFDLPGGEKHFLQLAVGPRWEPGSWHLLAVTWDADGFAASVDGGAFVRESVPGGRIAASFGEPGPREVLVVGDRTAESFLMDDLAVYARPLRDADVACLWRGRNAGAASP